MWKRKKVQRLPNVEDAQPASTRWSGTRIYTAAVQVIAAVAAIVLVGLVAHAVVVAHANYTLTTSSTTTTVTASAPVSNQSIVVTSSACGFESATVVINNTACPPRNDRGCQSGAVITIDDGTELCEYFDNAEGTSCTSACHAEDTTTTCDGDHTCASSDPTTCLGYCTVSSGEYDTDAPDCDDKLTFIDIFKWNTTGSGYDYNSWLHYSDFPAECHQIEGCRWYAAGLYTSASENSYYNPNVGYYPTCQSLLNMTNVECIRAYRFNFTEGLANAVLGAAFNDVYPYQYQAFACIYNYACGVRNETFMTDPDLLLKRSAEGSNNNNRGEIAMDRFARMTEAHAGAMRRQWTPSLQAFARRQDRLAAILVSDS